MMKLKPFASSALTEQIQIESQLRQLSAEVLSIEFFITGNLHLIRWPSLTNIIETRQDELWKTTCLEAFVSPDSSNSTGYLEINCAPNGNWNAYSFSSYRQGMKAAENTTVRLKERSQEANTASFRIEVQSTTPLSANSFGLTVVIEFTSGEKSYWALHHPKPTADFHDKDGWMAATR